MGTVATVTWVSWIKEVLIMLFLTLEGSRTSWKSRTGHEDIQQHFQLCCELQQRCYKLDFKGWKPAKGCKGWTIWSIHFFYCITANTYSTLDAACCLSKQLWLGVLHLRCVEDLLALHLVQVQETAEPHGGWKKRTTQWDAEARAFSFHRPPARFRVVPVVG